MSGRAKNPAKGASAPKAGKKPASKSSSKKEGASEAVADRLDESPSPGGASPKEKEAERVDGVEAARLRRLNRAGVAAPGLCAVTGVKMDVGPRSNPWLRPMTGNLSVSRIGSSIMVSQVSSSALEKAVEYLREIEKEADE